MARSAVTISTCTLNASNTVTQDAVDIASNHVIDVGDYKGEKLLVLIETTNTKSGLFAFKAGVGPQSVLGDLEVTKAAEGLFAFDLETARFKDADGYILIDVTSTATVTGKISCIAKS